jgi:mono/diheme cytochrome c family protein
LSVLGIATITAAFGQQIAPNRGLEVAQHICANCHGVRTGERSPNANAPAFPVIATVPGMTTIALQAALQTSHKTMPNVILSDNDRAAVIAYILSLKSK